MDDVDAAEALQAKNMLLSGDWITQRLNGTLYLDKAPLKYWLTASLYKVFGVHDWVARIPTAEAAIIVCWLVFRMGAWAESVKVGFNSGLVLATSVGLYLFTRTIIPDVILTLSIALSLWCLIRVLESERASPKWAFGMYAAMAAGVLTKGFVGVIFPASIAVVYLLVTGSFAQSSTWRRLYVAPGISLFVLIAAPWHILASLHNPPLFDFTLHAGQHFGGKFRGFFWFYFINEQVLRFLNQRWPRDYNTVPRIWFWLSQLVWFLPWSIFLPAISQLTFKPVNRASRMRLLAVIWISVVMLFFTFSTTQEYYSMPIYPAVALLLGSCMGTKSKWLRTGVTITGVVAIAAASVIAVILFRVWPLSTPGDIFSALVQHPELYTLSLGHMADLTIPAMAYLRLPLAAAGFALLIGGLFVLLAKCEYSYIAIAVMLIGFFQAARLALVVFDPYLSSHAVAQKLEQLPQGTLVICGKYNPLSSVFFYFKDKALQHDADLDILEYGSLAPGAPNISISDSELQLLWSTHQRVYILAKAGKLQHVKDTIGRLGAYLILQSGDKYLFSNQSSP
jgi:4-amino-4-deoxy-L-arabinose transferase-like glycosyltransferase